MLLHKSCKFLLFGEGMRMGTPSRKQSCCERKGTGSGFFGDDRSIKSSVEMSAIQAARTSTSKMKNSNNNQRNGAYLVTQQLIKPDRLIKSLSLRLLYHVILL